MIQLSKRAIINFIKIDTYARMCLEYGEETNLKRIMHEEATITIFQNLVNKELIKKDKNKSNIVKLCLVEFEDLFEITLLKEQVKSLIIFFELMQEYEVCANLKYMQGIISRQYTKVKKGSPKPLRENQVRYINNHKLIFMLLRMNKLEEMIPEIKKVYK